ncbi:hypothetical protein [Metaclostridioides mangenotii]|uniref:hypothetical protein n=1 Tax=Metaclostridioides mangenotii TaxID=1540 RepID=UPI00046371BA|nr:hypothetical protein [Clostridioides mangenotii]
MEQLFELLDKKFEPVWTIIAVIIGGVISYVSTSRAEKVKNKIQLQREKLEQILIPYCTCLEDVMAEINKVYTMEKNLDKDILQQWFINLKKPFEYLKASKRVYLSLESKKLLEEYKDLINCFEEELQKEYSLFLREYEEFLKERLVEFVNIPKPDKTNIYMDKTAENKVKLAIINKTKITLLGNIDLVIAVYGEDSECYNSTYINIGNKSREIGI